MKKVKFIKFSKNIMLILLIALFISNSTLALTLSQVDVDSEILEREKSKIIKLEATHNTRDLDGYKTLNNKITKYNTFFRSDNTDKLTKSDIKKLKEEYNLKTVIDLRPEVNLIIHLINSLKLII